MTNDLSFKLIGTGGKTVHTLGQIAATIIIYLFYLKNDEEFVTKKYVANDIPFFLLSLIFQKQGSLDILRQLSHFFTRTVSSFLEMQFEKATFYKMRTFRAIKKTRT